MMPCGSLLRSFSAFRAALDDYLLTLEQEGKAPATVAIYRYAIERLRRFAGEVDPQRIDTALLRRFLRSLQDEGLSATTQADYLRAIKTWLRWLAAEDGYGVAPDAGARARPPRIVKDQIRPFSEEEIARLFAACDPARWHGQ